MTKSEILKVEEIAKSNALMGADQVQEYSTYQEAYDVYYENVLDTIDECLPKEVYCDAIGLAYDVFSSTWKDVRPNDVLWGS